MKSDGGMNNDSRRSAPSRGLGISGVHNNQHHNYAAYRKRAEQWEEEIMTTFEVKRLKALYQLRLEIVDRAEQEEWSSQRLCIAQAKRDMMEKVFDVLGVEYNE